MEYGDAHSSSEHLQKNQERKGNNTPLAGGLKKMLTQPKQFKAQITKQFIGIMVVIIIGVAVVIPVINDVIAVANLTGTTATLVGLLPLFIAIALILVVVGLY